MSKRKISIVVPVYYNEESIPRLIDRFEEVAKYNTKYDFEFVFVDDFSEDNSVKIISEYLSRSSYQVKLIRLSKNHGSFTACLAGLAKCEGDAAVIISADLQDPPELINEMINEWESGHRSVLAARNSRKDPFFSKIFARAFYSVIRKFALSQMPKGGFDFCLIDRKIIDIICSIEEKNTSLMGLILWSGFNRKVIYYDRKKREHGESMWTFWKKFKYFVDSFVAFSFAPVRLATLFGFFVSFVGFLYALFLMYDRIFNQTLIHGITALIVIVLFLGGIQLIILGIFGEYLWRILDESRKRPTFIIDSYETNEK